ncbi:hypothetical protein SA42_1366 [Salmonella enterica subsp. enterica serovar Agona str. 42.E.09]|nr:hypothetical protein SA42_1366 [Salmonella enterica subsp. enterica serovar Agona str. 42.E.09]
MPVYPRWRGEHNKWDDPVVRDAGLSPLARGTLVFICISLPLNRFIPAGAGNTPKPGFALGQLAVYPRWRGEHNKWDDPVVQDAGLSPLARGTLHRFCQSNRQFRFIPAGAGNTATNGVLTSQSPVYPRWRGEHTKRIAVFITFGGSAPHSTNGEHGD